jgi:hypothetical protein
MTWTNKAKQPIHTNSKAMVVARTADVMGLVQRYRSIPATRNLLVVAAAHVEPLTR